MRAVIYARYSSDNQREESIEGQLRECKEYTDYNEMTVVATYIDRALSARTDDRPEFQKMITDSYKSTFDADPQKAAPVRVQSLGLWTGDYTERGLCLFKLLYCAILVINTICYKKG